jgi:outer membrane protein assembly factor BamB
VKRIVLLAAACASPRTSSPAPPVAAPFSPQLRPSAGADLDGPIPTARVTTKTHGDGPAMTVSLGADRPAIAVDVPRPPRGGAVGFSFADERKGWVASIPDANQLPSVAYGDGRIFVSGGFESVSFYSLDAQDGHMLWASQGLEDNGPTAASYDQGRVIFNTESCTLFVMDAKSGQKLWFKFLGDPTLAQPAEHDGLIFAQHPGTAGPTFSAYQIGDGTEVWSHEIDGELLGAPVVSGDSVFASTIQGTTYRFVSKSGHVVWAQDLGATSAPWVVDGELYLSARKSGKERQIVVSTKDGEIVRVARDVAAPYLADVPDSMDNWKQVWAYEGSRPVIADGVRYEAMGGTVAASSTKDGRTLWTRSTDKPTERGLGSVALAGPQVVVSTRTGVVYGLDVDTGYTVWSYDVGVPVVAEPIVAKGWVYVSTVDGRVIALQVSDPTLDGWHMWGGDPEHDGPVARLDERPQHASR